MDITIGKLKISGAALLAFAAAYFFDTDGILTAVIIAAAAHEAGHFAALKLCGGQLTELRLELCGFVMRCESGLSYTAEIVTASAGPIASLILAVAASLIGRYYDYLQAYILSGVSLVFCVFNALPALPLDGGKIVYAAMARLTDIEKAERVTCVLTCTVILALLIAGTVLLIKTKLNFTLLAAALGLLISYCKRSGVSIKSKRKIVGSESWIKN